MRTRILWHGALMVALLAAVPAFGGEPWLHVRVEDGTGEGLSVDLPLRMLETMLPAIGAEGLSGGRIAIDDLDSEGLDLREMLTALRDAPDGDFITIREANETVQVAKEAGDLIVRVDEEDETVRIRVPMRVAEALVGSEPNELDLMAAMRELAAYPGEDLVRIESPEERVRIWVDENERGD